MGKYATEQKFGGQRASLTRAVLVRREPQLTCESTIEDRGVEPGIVARIEAGNPVILVWATRAGDPFVTLFDGPFFDVRTEEDFEEMPIGSWCWPLRV